MANILDLPADAFNQYVLMSLPTPKDVLSTCNSNPRLNAKCNYNKGMLFKLLLKRDYGLTEFSQNPRDLYFRLSRIQKTERSYTTMNIDNIQNMHSITMSITIYSDWKSGLLTDFLSEPAVSVVADDGSWIERYHFMDGLLHDSRDEPAIFEARHKAGSVYRPEESSSIAKHYKNGFLHRDGGKPAVIHIENGEELKVLYYENGFIVTDFKSVEGRYTETFSFELSKSLTQERAGRFISHDERFVKSNILIRNFLLPNDDLPVDNNYSWIRYRLDDVFQNDKFYFLSNKKLSYIRQLSDLIGPNFRPYLPTSILDYLQRGATKLETYTEMIRNTGSYDMAMIRSNSHVGVGDLIVSVSFVKRWKSNEYNVYGIIPTVEVLMEKFYNPQRGLYKNLMIRIIDSLVKGIVEGDSDEFNNQLIIHISDYDPEDARFIEEYGFILNRNGRQYDLTVRK